MKQFTPLNRTDNMKMIPEHVSLYWTASLESRSDPV